MKHPYGSSAEAWQGPMPTSPGYQTSCNKCPDCQQVVSVAGNGDDWDRAHGAVCTRGHVVLPLGEVSA